ncbi:MAG: hypothetical protein V3T84_04585 [Phycisphaerales bacterium]
MRQWAVGIRKKIAMAGLAAGVLAASNVVCAQIPCGGYEVTAIIHAPECPPFGFPPTVGTDINEPIDGALPNVVGYYRCPAGEDQAFLWIGNEDKFITVPMPPGTILSRAFDITPDGAKIVGSFDLGGDGLGNLGFLYNHETGKFTNLGTLPGGNWSEAHGINTLGQSTGFWGNNNIGPWQAFIWEDGVMTDLGPSIGGANNRGLDINNNGALTGWWQREDNGDRIAFVWQDRVMTDLGPIPGGFSSQGEGINIHNQITGWGKLPDPEGGGTVAHPFFWTDGRMIDLGTLPSFPLGWGRDISDAGTIVGGFGGAGEAGFIWQDGVMTDLNDLISPELGLNIETAWAINQAGQIIADGENSTSDVVSFVLIPIESPIGDFDGDCQVGASDLLILLAAWGPCLDCDECDADLDQNCSVGASDLLILLTNWG